MGFQIFLTDLRSIFTDLDIRDLGRMLLWAFWFTVLLASLKGVDRRDELAQVTYMAVLAAFGVVFVLVFPIGVKSEYGPQSQLILFLMMLMVASVRWIVQRRVSDLDRRIQAEIAVNKKK